MKESYVLDESVAHCAATGKNERGQEDPSSLELVLVLYEQCHAVVFSTELWGRWQRRLSSLADSGDANLALRVLRVLNLFRTNQEKFQFISDPASFSDEEKIPEDDVYWIRLVVATTSVGATTDNRLIERLNEVGVTESHNLVILRPEAAVARLTQAQ